MSFLSVLYVLGGRARHGPPGYLPVLLLVTAALMVLAAGGTAWAGRIVAPLLVLTGYLAFPQDAILRLMFAATMAIPGAVFFRYRVAVPRAPYSPLSDWSPPVGRDAPARGARVYHLRGRLSVHPEHVARTGFRYVEEPVATFPASASDTDLGAAVFAALLSAEEGTALPDLDQLNARVLGMLGVGSWHQLREEGSACRVAQTRDGYVVWAGGDDGGHEARLPLWGDAAALGARVRAAVGLSPAERGTGAKADAHDHVPHLVPARTAAHSGERPERSPTGALGLDETTLAAAWREALEPPPPESPGQRWVRLNCWASLGVLTLLLVTTIVRGLLHPAALEQRYTAGYATEELIRVAGLLAVLVILWRERLRHGGMGARAAAGFVALVMLIVLVVFLGRLSIQVEVAATSLWVTAYAFASNAAYALLGSRRRAG